MTTSLAWVLGSGGLLGSAVEERLPMRLPGTRAWSPGSRRFSWEQPELLAQEHSEAAAAFGRATAESGRPWMLLWCAGTGTVASPAKAMAQETRSLELLLDRVSTAMGERPGSVFLASSAGGVYGGNRESPLTEATPPLPVSDYGREKLRQEQLLDRWAAARPWIRTLTGRLSNLYGTRQNLSKPQGLISHLSRCLLHHVPAHVYAPLDTLRDHLYAPDAADQILAGMQRLRDLPSVERVTRIIASGQTSSIAAILFSFARIARRRPRIVCSATSAGRLQPTRLALKTTVWADLAPASSTPLIAGIDAVYRSQLAMYQAGRLPAPTTKA